MATWTRTDVRAHAAELAALDDATIDYWISQAETEVDDRVFGSLTARAGANLTAHLLVMAGAGASVGVPAPGSGGTGPVSAVTVGSVSVSYETSAMSGGGSARAALALTRWGVEYARLVRLRAGGPWLADLGD